MPPTSLTTRTTCRVCDSPYLTPILSLGDQHIAGAFAEPGGGDPIARTVPMDLVRCDMTKSQDACGLVQLRHTVPASVLYRSYWYRSGVNRTMTDNLHGIAQAASGMVGLKSGDLVVDIGCNDGTLLDGYNVDGLQRVGFDPSDVSRYAEGRGHDIVRDFYSLNTLRDHSNEKAKVVTSIAMLYDLENPAAFVAEIAQALDPVGVWVLELHYLPSMLQMRSFDAIVHEHLAYYSLAVLERLITDAGLEVVRAELNAMNGGSIRLFAGHAGKRRIAAEDAQGLQDLRVREFELRLDAPDPYDEFAANTRKVRDDLYGLCARLVDDGKTIHAYGASTKGNTILQYAGLDSTLVSYAADRNPDKWGSETIGTHIPIVSEKDSRAMRPDYYLVLPWHFLDEFLEREREYLDAGGRFITPLPEVRIVPEVASLVDMRVPEVNAA